MKKYLLLISLIVPLKLWSQSYSQEIYEDSDGNPIGGFVALGIVFAVVYLIEKYRKIARESKKNAEKELHKRKTATSVAESSLNQYKDISKYQNYSAWRKGYIDAMYDIQNNITRNLYNKSIADLIREYHIKQGYGLVEANEILEKIGYFQHLEHNNKLLLESGREQFPFTVLDRLAKKKS